VDITKRGGGKGPLAYDDSVPQSAGQGAAGDVAEGILEAERRRSSAGVGPEAASILGSLQHTFVVADPTLPDCPLVFASDSFLRLTGYTREEILGQNCRFLQGEHSDKATVQQLRQAVEEGFPITTRLLNYKKSGEPFWNLLTMTPVKDSSGRVIKIIGVQVDITKRGGGKGPLAYDDSVPQSAGQGAAGDVAEGILEAERRRSSAGVGPEAASILGSLQHTFVVADPTLPDCPLVFASDSFLRLTGYTREEILGQNCRFLQGEHSDKATVQQLRQAVEEGFPITTRLLNYKKSGEPFWNLLTMTPVKDSSGRVIKIIGVQMDVTKKNDDHVQQHMIDCDNTFPHDAGHSATATIANSLAGIHTTNRSCVNRSAAGVEDGRMDALEQNTVHLGQPNVRSMPSMLKGHANRNKPGSRLIKRLSRSMRHSLFASQRHPAKDPIGSKPWQRPHRVPRVALDLATTVERLDHAFVVCDPGLEDCPIVFASDAFSGMLGFHREEILGRHPDFLLGPSASKEAQAALANAISCQNEVTISQQSFRSNGESFASQIYLCPMKDASGRCRFLVAVLVDLSKSQDDAADVPDSEMMSAAVRNVLGGGEDEVQDPFEAIDSVSGVFKEKAHAASNRGSQLLKEASLDGPLRFEDFKLVKSLGSGASGSVSLMELRETGHLFAVKSVNKQDMISRNKVVRVVAEDYILREIDHPLLALCYCTISTQTHVHYVLEHCEGGDLYSLLNRQGDLKEAHVKFYGAEVLMSLKYLHMLGFVYRDLKPENVLLHGGHAILTDFDLSYTKGNTEPCVQRQAPTEATEEDVPPLKSGCACGMRRNGESLRLQNQPKFTFVAKPQVRSNSFVGTEEYLAPEIIIGKGHTASVDWWSFGILLYELAFGQTPFRGPRRDDTFDRIMKKPLEFPDDRPVSPAFKDLLHGLLAKSPSMRLGAEGGAEEIQRHPFFKGVSWSLLRNSKPPFRSTGSPRNSGSSRGSGEDLGSTLTKDTGADALTFNY